MRENVTHLTLLATFTEKLSVENKKLVKEIQQLQQKATEERRRYQEVKRKQQITEDEVQALAKKTEAGHARVSEPSRVPSRFSCKWNVYFPAFYTHPQGY